MARGRISEKLNQVSKCVFCFIKNGEEEEKSELRQGRHIYIRKLCVPWLTLFDEDNSLVLSFNPLL